jgi:hypothetical protein
MNNVEMFKSAFLYRCKEEGITTLDGIHAKVKAALNKTAAEDTSLGATARSLFGGWIGSSMSDDKTIGGIVGSGIGAAFPHVAPYAFGLGIPALAGAGILAGKSMAEAKEDPIAGEVIKNQELEREYSRLAEKIRANAKRRQLLEGR